jgi:hypothetical protein
MNGKGSKPRPKSVDEQTFAQRWEQTFGVPCVHEAQGSDEEGQGQAEGCVAGES